MPISSILGAGPPNTHKVPKKYWNRWHPLAQEVFNNVYENRYHSGDLGVKQKVVDTIYYNAAWEAAYAFNMKIKLLKESI